MNHPLESAVETPRAWVTVTRTSEEDVQDRQVVLALDGQPWTSLMFGQSATREIAPGRHSLKADNTFFRKTAEFDADPAAEVNFSVVNRRGPVSELFMLLGAPLYYLRLARR